MSVTQAALRSEGGTSGTVVTAVVPALNEEETVAAVVAGLRGVVDAVVVVDGASTDATAERARSAGATVVAEPRRGYGRACLTGAEHADAAVVVFVDADGSADPAQARKLVDPILADTADLVLGSRVRGRRAPGAMAPHQHVGNVLVAAILRRRHGVPISDVSPYRAVRTRALLGLGMTELTYGWPTEMIVRAAAAGLRVVEVPVDHRTRAGGRSKVSGSPRASLLAAWHMLRIASARPRPGPAPPDVEGGGTRT